MMGLMRQNCNVACLQKRKNPMEYVFPCKQHVQQKMLVGLQKKSETRFVIRSKFN